MSLPQLHPSDDALIDLALGLETSDTASSILEHLKDCSQCEERFRLEVGQRERLRALGPPTVAVDRPVRERKWTRVAAAAAVLLIVGLLVRFGLSPATEEERRFWIPAELLPSHQRAAMDDPEADSLYAALSVYRSGDLEAAARRLEDLRVHGAEEDLRRLYLSSCLATQGRYTDSLALLEGARIGRMPSPWRDHGWWLEYEISSELGQAARAESALSELALDEGPLSERARRAQSATPQSSNPAQ